MQNIVQLHQDNAARVLGRLVLLQNTLPEQPGRFACCRREVLLLQINVRQLLSRAFLMQVNRALLQKSSAESTAKEFVMQNKASGLPASLLGFWEKSAEVLAKAAEILAKAAGVPAKAAAILDRMSALPDKGHEVTDR